MKTDILDWIGTVSFVTLIAGLAIAAQGMANAGNLQPTESSD